MAHRGVVVPMVSPATPSGDLDEAAAHRLIDWLVEGGVDGVFVLGTTGEAASLPMRVRRQLARLAAERVAGRCLVYAGIGSNCLGESIAAGREYLAQGADAVVAHLPAYFPLAPAEMVQYYRMLADRLEGPLVIYNMPPTTHMSIPLDALEELSGHPNIVGLKDSENDLGRLKNVLAAFRGRSDFAVFVGPSVHAAETLAAGADGVVPSSGNLVPDLWRRLYGHTRAERRAEATTLQQQLNAIAHVYQAGRSLGQSMAGLKAALEAKGLCGPTVLPPLCTLEAAERARIRNELASLGLV
jgi:dihydrodipicolinate synthase/N-acetylneuraminate lyase